jgi:uncharacterized membrane protein YfcA
MLHDIWRHAHVKRGNSKGYDMSLAWLAGAGILAVSSFVFGLTGFGIGLVSLSLLPFLIPPATAVPLMTVYTTAFALVMAVQLRRHVVWPSLVELLLGSVVGTPLGVWVLIVLSPGMLRRLIGVVLMAVVVIELRGVYSHHLTGRSWGLGAGFLSGLLGGAVGTPGPPVVLYAAAQGWKPYPLKATLQAFFVANQTVILVGYWWTGLLTPEVMWLVVAYALPAIAGLALGMHLFARVNHVRFRRLVFALLLVTGLTLCVRG